MTLSRIKNIFMLVVCASMLAMGFYMIFEGMFHVDEVEGGHTSVEILSIGKITGNQRIMIVAFGMLLIFFSAKFLWRIDIKETLRKGSRFKHYISDAGKEIAKRMRAKDGR